MTRPRPCHNTPVVNRRCDSIALPYSGILSVTSAKISRQAVITKQKLGNAGQQTANIAYLSARLSSICEQRCFIEERQTHCAHPRSRTAYPTVSRGCVNNLTVNRAFLRSLYGCMNTPDGCCCIARQRITLHPCVTTLPAHGTIHRV